MVCYQIDEVMLFLSMCLVDWRFGERLACDAQQAFIGVKHGRNVVLLNIQQGSVFAAGTAADNAS